MSPAWRGAVALAVTHAAVAPAYRGCSALRPRRGVARTSPRSLALVSAALHRRYRPIALDLGAGAHLGVACWRSRKHWLGVTVPMAYQLYYDELVRPVMPGEPVSLDTVVRVAKARAHFADHATGRNCRPRNATVAALAGVAEKTVTRASAVLRLLGVATEVLRGRPRTLVERMASWRVGDKARGWASVWVLHDSQVLNRRLWTLSTHLRSGLVREKTSPCSVVTTRTGSPSGRRQRGAARRRAPDAGGCRLARAWRTDPHAPPWAQRYSPSAWAAVLAAPAAAGWTPRDLNQLITDWIGVGRYVPDRPYTPIGLLGAILAWHGRDNLAERPAALDEAREAAELAAAHARIADQNAARQAHQEARAQARFALGGAGHQAARAAAAEAARNAARRRTHTAATDAETLQRVVRRARSPRPEHLPLDE